MRNRDDREAVSPWSWFVPILLAVALGILVADVVRLAVVSIFVRQTAVERVRPAVRDGAITVPPASGVPRAATLVATPAATTPAPADEHLPGPLGTRRDGRTRACINGHVAVRVRNGWQQEVDGDAPVDCVATSQ